MIFILDFIVKPIAIKYVVLEELRQSMQHFLTICNRQDLVACCEK